MPTFFSSSKRPKVEVTVANITVIKTLGLVLLSVLFWAALGKATHALTLVFIAFFLALALNSPIHWLSLQLPGKSRGNRTLSTSAAFLIVVLLLVGFIASIVPPFIKQTNNFIHQAPNIVENLHNDNTSLGRFVRDHHLESQSNKFANQLSDRLKNISGSAFTTITRIFSSVFSVLAVLVLTFMMLIEGPHWIDLAKRLIPEHRSSQVEKMAHDMYRVVKGYVNGQVFLAVLVALFVAIPLFILHISYPVALVVVVFVCGLIPLVGHSIGAVIVSVVALLHSLPAAIIILAYYIIYMQIEAYIIQPQVQANNTDMSPLLVFSSVIIGVSFNGLLGGLVAIPIAGCLRIVALDYLERKRLLSPGQVQRETK